MTRTAVVVLSIVLWSGVSLVPMVLLGGCVFCETDTDGNEVPECVTVGPQDVVDVLQGGR